MTNHSSDSYALIVGDRAHKIAAALSKTTMPADRALRARTLTEAGSEIFSRFPVEYRPRESLFQAVTAAGVYLSRFRPEAPWTFLGSEVRSGNCIFDLVFQSAAGVLVDELKLGKGRAHDANVREQINRYLIEGKHLWGNRFIGVRLCPVNEPRASRLYLANSKRSLLVTESNIAQNLEIR